MRFSILAACAFALMGNVAEAEVDRATCLAQCQTKYDKNSDKCRQAWIDNKGDDRNARNDRCMRTIKDGLDGCNSFCPAK